MRLPPDAKHWREVTRPDFRFCCEDCGHFEPVAERCAHGWPEHEHRRSYYRGAIKTIVFCKEFELR